MRRLKIAMIVDKSAPIYVGGYEVRAFELARRLARKHDVRMYTSLDQPEYVKDDVSFHQLLGTGFQKPTSGQRSLFHSLLFSVRLSRNPFGRWTPDVVIVEAIPYFHLTLMRPWIRRAKALKIINVNEAWFEYPYLKGRKGRLLTRAIKRLLKTGVEWADCCIAISSVTANSLSANYSASNVRVIAMGVDRSVIREDNAGELSTKKFDFVSMSRLVSIKRQDDFLRALALLKTRYDWKGSAAIIGFGPERDRLEDLRDTLGLKDQVEFLGFLVGEAKYRALRASRTFVLPSEREGFSIAALEAIACGLPAIVARPTYPEVFGTSDFVTQEYTGLYYPLGDTAKFSECMHRLLTDESLREQLSKNALRVGRQYDWDDICSSLESLIVSMSLPITR